MNQTLYLVIFLILMFGMFYFFIIRPQRKRQTDHQTFVDSLKRGDKVITIGGILGEIDRIDTDSIVIKTESGALLRMVKNGIAMRQAEPPPAQ